MPVPAVRLWTGREARALRGALRLSVRAFAEHLGIAARTVSKWEQLGQATHPHPDTQAILDTALDRAGTAAQIRFQMLLADAGTLYPAASRQMILPAWDYETWSDDLDRTVVALSRQDFTTGTTLIERWLARYPVGQLDTRGLYLHARSLVLLGDAHRDQGRLDGPLSAPHSYRRALAIFGDLDIPRRVAQIELALTVVAEMAGQLQAAAQGYSRLADDERLSGRDRARARLWIGTALSKDGSMTTPRTSWRPQHGSSRNSGRQKTGRSPSRNSRWPIAASATSARPSGSSTAPTPAAPTTRLCSASGCPPRRPISCSPMRQRVLTGWPCSTRRHSSLSSAGYRISSAASSPSARMRCQMPADQAARLMPATSGKGTT